MTAPHTPQEQPCPTCKGRKNLIAYDQNGYWSVDCPDCNGTGKLPQEPCSECNGTGIDSSTTPHYPMVCGSCEGTGVKPAQQTRATKLVPIVCGVCGVKRLDTLAMSEHMKSEHPLPQEANGELEATDIAGIADEYSFEPGHEDLCVFWESYAHSDDDCDCSSKVQWKAWREMIDRMTAWQQQGVQAAEAEGFIQALKWVKLHKHNTSVDDLIETGIEHQTGRLAQLKGDK